MKEQEKFWAGEFGDQYNPRNQGIVESNTAFFAKALAKTSGIKRTIELGAGTGQNMLALTRLIPGVETMGVEINEQAAHEIPCGYVFRQSLFDFIPPNYEAADLAMTKGLLIHIAPEDLSSAYEKLYQCSRKYILIAEYYSPRPREIEYRGHKNKLWARDFAGEILARFPDLELLDYGFQYYRDPLAPQDDITWFMMEKRS